MTNEYSSSNRMSLPASFPYAEQATRLLSTIPVDTAQFSALNRFKNERLSQMKPWREFVDVNRFSKPMGTNGAQIRIQHNLSYYQANYLVIFLCLLVYILFSNFTLLFVMAFIALAYSFISKMPTDGVVPLANGAVVATQRQYFLMLSILSIPLLWMASAGSVLFWLIGVSGVIILGHAAFTEPPVETAFEEEP